MAKKELEAEDSFGDFDISDSDFMLGDERDAPPDTRSNTRKVVENVAKGAFGEVKNTAKNPKFYREILKKSFPSSYGIVDDAIDTTSKTMYDLYNEISREEKPKFKRIAGRLASMLPEEDSRLKRFLKKIEGEDRATQYSRESTDEAAIESTLANIFKAQQTQNKLDQAKEIVRDRISKDASDKSLDVLNRIYQNTGALVAYNETITQGYQRKSLELQLRSHLLQAETARRTMDYFSIQKAQLEAIVKNTGLPEYVKLKDFERFKQGIKSSIGNKLYGEGSRIKQGIDAIADKARDALSGFSMGLSNADMAIDSMASMQEQIRQMNETFIQNGMEPLSKAEMAGAAAAGMTVEWVQNAVSKRIQKHTPLSVREKLAKAAFNVQNPGAYIKNKLESESWQEREMEEGPVGAIFRFGREMLEGFMDSKKSASFKKPVNVSDLNSASPGGITNQANLSLTTVIPGYLAGIQREVAMLRTGQDQPLYKYDYQRGDFVKQSTFDRRVMQDLQNTAKSSMYEYKVDSVARYVDPENQLKGNEALLLKIFLARLSQIDNFSYTLEEVEATDAFKQLPDSVKTHVVNFFTEIETAEDKQQRRLELSTRMTNAKDAIESLNQVIEDKLKLGGSDVLKKHNLISEAADYTGYRTDPQAIMAFIHDAIYDTEKQSSRFGSDIKIKNRIRPTSAEAVLNRTKRGSIDWSAPSGQISGLSPSGKRWSPSNAFEAFKRTKLYDWFYDSQHKDKKQHAGPMAGDVRQTFGEAAAPGGESIDLQEINAAYFASVQHIDKRLTAIESGGQTDTVKKIKEDTGEIVELLKRVGFGFRLPGFEDISKIDYRTKWTKFKTYFNQKKDQAITQGRAKLDDAGLAISDFHSAHIQPRIDHLLEYYNKNKDPAKNKLYALFDTAVDMAQSVMQRGNDFFRNSVPAGLKNAKDMISRAYNRFKDAYLEYKDIYLVGETEPILRGIKISAGNYYNRVTKEPILTMKEILECQDDIVDAAGNIVLSVKDRAKGLIDRQGQPFIGTINRIARMSGEFARKGLDTVIEKGSQLLGLGKNGVLNIKEFFKNFKIGTGFGGGIAAPKTHQVIVDIRDILLGNQRAVRQRLIAEGDRAGKTTSTSDAGSSSTNNFNEATVNNDTNGSFTNENNPASQTDGMGRLFGAMGSIRDKFTDFKNSSRGQKINARYQQMKDKITNANVVEKVKNAQMFDKIKNSKLAGNVGGFFGTIRNLAGGIASGALNAASALTSPSETTENQPTIDWGGAKGQLYRDASGNRKNKLSKKDREWNDTDGDGRRDGGIDDQREKQEALLKERNKNKASLDNTQRYQGIGVDGLLGMASKLFGMLSSGIGGVISMAGTVLSKIPGLGALAAGAFKGVSAFMGKGGLIRNAISLTGKAAWGTARFAIPAIAKIGFAGASMVGSAALGAVTTVAGTMLSALASPIVAGAGLLALGAYGMYKLYQYANRNNANDIEVARLRQYGFGYNTAVQRYNHCVYMLEAYFQDARIHFNGQSASILSKKVKAEEILEIFGIDEKDTEKVDRLTQWLENRFKPVFLNHVTALHRVNRNAKLADLSNPAKILTPAETTEYLENARFTNGPYSYDVSPIEGMESLDVDAEEIQENYNNLIKQYRAQAKASATKIKVDEKKISETPEQATQRKVVDAFKDKPVGKIETAKQQIEQNKRAIAAASGQSEDAGKEPSGGAASTAPSSGYQAIPLAPGALVDGASGRQYIKLGPNAKLDGLDPSVAKLFYGMVTEYNTMTGKQILVNSAVRSREDQARLHSQDPNKAAKPGTSLHEYGLAIDISSQDANQLEKLGLMRKYGFTRPIGQETWHIEPAGIQADLNRAKNDLDTRAKLIAASVYKGGGGYGILPGAAKYRRNTQVAMLAFDSSGKPMEQAKISQLTSQLGLSGNNTPGKIATDIKSKSNSEISKSNNIPNPEAARQALAQGNEAVTKTSKMDPKTAVKQAAAAANVDEKTLLTMAAVESSLNPNAKNGRMLGLTQIKDSTWEELLSKHGPKYGLNQNTSPFDPYANALMAAEYIKSNQRALGQYAKGQPTDIYLTHLLGPTGANSVLSADENEIAAKLRPEAAKSNRTYFYKPDGTPRTVKELQLYLSEHLDKKANEAGVVLEQNQPVAKLPNTQAQLKSPAPVAIAQPAAKGLVLDNRGMGQPTSNATGTPVAMPSTAHLETLAEQANTILTDSLSVLKRIQDNTSPENFAKVLATAIVTMNETANQNNGKKETPKQQDRKNMGRDAPTTKSSLDLKRYAT